MYRRNQCLVGTRTKDYAQRMDRRQLLFAAALGWALAVTPCLSLAGTTLYRWVDANGVVHYSDTPVLGAEKMEIAATRARATPPKALDDADPVSRPIAGVQYTRLAIISPDDGATYSNIQSLVVQASLEPALAANHLLYFVVDGQQQPPSGLAASIAVVRGEHTVVATVVDENNQTLFTSAPVTFSVHNTSIAKPPRGPALSKPPK